MYVRVYKEKVCSVRVCEKTEKKRYAGPEADGLSQSLSMWMEQRTFCASFFFFLSLFQKFLKWPFWLLLPVRACTTVSGAKKEKSFACRRRQWTWTDTPIYFYYYIYLRAFYFTFGIIFSPFFPFPPLFPGLWPGCEKEREEKKSKERHFEGIRRESSDCDRVCVWNWKRKIIILGGKLCVAFIILEEGQNNKKNCVFGWGG